MAAPDAANVGLRVQRHAQCGLDLDAEASYLVKAAGVTADVQWLLTAQAGDTFLVTATLQHAGDSFALFVLSHLPLTGTLRDNMSDLMLKTMMQTHSVHITHKADASPLTRLRDLMGEAISVPQMQALSKRRRLN